MSRKPLRRIEGPRRVSMKTVDPPLVINSRTVLRAGFGGLLLLMAFSGLDAIQALQHIQRANDEIRDEFLRRTRVLERIRRDLYVSGTYVRDYLLEPESGKAGGHRYSLAETRKDMDAALDGYRPLATQRDAQQLELLKVSLAEYWSVLEPVFHWSTAQRQQAGFPF